MADPALAGPAYLQVAARLADASGWPAGRPANLAEARAVIELWRRDYNHVRPHSALGGLTPDTVGLTPAAGRLRGCGGSAARPLPPATEISYEAQGLPL